MMTRAEFEFAEAERRGKSVSEMHALGYYSARLDEDDGRGPGWQAVAVPPDSPEFERRTVLASLRGLSPQPFGGA